MSNKQKLAERVRALLAKTQENGATEAEAMAAAEKARELMDKYQIDLGEVGMEAEGVIKAFSDRTHYKTLQIKDRLAVMVAAYCDVKVWKNDRLTFFGLASDAEFATWLLDSLDAHIRRSAVEYMLTARIVATGAKMPRWEAEKAFVLGAISRINQRLNMLTDERKRAMRQQAGGGRSLVVVKSALVERAFADLNMRLRSGSRSNARVHDSGAFKAGVAAGDRASFGRPVNGGGGVAMIGRR